MPDCGCGKKSKCITKELAEQIMVSFVRCNPQFNRKTRRATLMFIKKELKRLDCGCGCKGKDKFAKKYLKGGKLDDCPPGWRNDGLTCVEPCAPDERDDGLTCRKKCTGEQIDDGLTCRNPIKSSMNECPAGSKDVAGTCWGEVRKDCVDDCFNHPAPGCKTWECGRLRGAFGEDWGPKWCTDCNLRCGQTCWGVQGITKQLHERQLRTWGGEVYGQAIRGKRIVGRVNWQATADELAKGFEAFLTGKLDYAALFDPEKNGVGEAFRKFGKDTEAAFEDVGKRFEKAFDPNQNGVAKAFADFAKEAEKNLDQFGQDFVNKCKDPDMWVQVITIMAQVAGGILAAAIAVGTLGAGTGLAIGLGMALSAVGPAVKMIADGARGKPIDGLDIAMLALAVIPPVPGTGVVMGEGIRKAIQYGNYAATAGKLIVAGVQFGQTVGAIPSTCIVNCPPPPTIPTPDIEETSASDEAILKLQPEDTIDAYIYPPKPAKRYKNPKFMNADAWLKKYKEDNPPARATETTKEESRVANEENDAEEEDEVFDFGGPGEEDEVFDFGGPGEEDEVFDFGGPGEGDEEEFDFGGPGEGDEEEFDFGGPGEGDEEEFDLGGLEDTPEDEEIDLGGLEDTPEDEEIDLGGLEDEEFDLDGPEEEEFDLGELEDTPEDEEIDLDGPEEEEFDLTPPVIDEEHNQIEPTPFEPSPPPVKPAPMTAQEFLGTPKPAPMTAKEFLSPKTDPKPLPPPVIPQKQTRFVEGISADRTVQKLPKREYRVSSAPALPLPPANKVIIPTFSRGKYATPKDEKFYLLRGGMSAEDALAVATVPVQTGDRSFQNPYTGENAIISSQIPRGPTCDFNVDCYAANYPERFAALENNKDKMTGWWVDKGYDAGDNPCCGAEILPADQALAAINALKGRMTACKTTDSFWDEATKTCDDTKNSDGTDNADKAMCRRRNGYWENQHCNLYKERDGGYPTQGRDQPGPQKACSMFGNFTNPYDTTYGYSCDEDRNVDGTDKTEMDACVSANNFWNGEKCDIRKDQFGNEKSDKELCGFTNNYWDGEKCDETKDYAGKVKSAEQMCTENDRGVFNSSFKTDYNACKTTDQFGQCQGGMDTIEVPECAQKQPAFPRTFAEMTDYINKTSKKGVVVREKNQAEAKKKAEEDAKIKTEEDVRVQKIESYIDEINAFGNTLNLLGSTTFGEEFDAATKRYGNFNKSFVLQTAFDALKNKNPTLAMPSEDKFLPIISKLIIYPEIPDIDGVTVEMVPMGKSWYILFAKNTGRGKPQKSLTLYYADWCPHCKPLVPLWKKLNVPGVTIRMLEQKQNNEFKVQGYPTIVYRDGKTTEMYTGERSRSAIIKYLKNKL